MIDQTQILALIEIASRAAMSQAERLWFDTFAETINAQLQQAQQTAAPQPPAPPAPNNGE